MTNDEYRSKLTFSYLVGVQSHIDDGISTLDGLVPMFAPILQSVGGNIFDPVQIAASFTAIYGSRIHPYAVRSLAPKLCESGYLIETGREQRSNLAIYTVSKEIKIDSNVDESHVERLFESFRNFANEQAFTHGLEKFENSELDSAFIIRLQSFPLPDQRTWKNYRSESETTRTISLSKISALSEEELKANRKAQWLNAIFSDYVLHKLENSSEEYELFKKVATGSIVVEAVLNFCDPKVEKNLQNTWFVFDTPLLMDLLDLDSPERHVFAKEMFAQLKHAKARFGVFGHSVAETSHNIKAALAAYSDRNSHGAIGIRMISNFDFVRRIAAVNQNLKGEIKDLGFTIFEAPSSSNSRAFLSDDLENHLSNNIGYYAKDAARLHDASSISAIVRLRGNHKSVRRDFSSTKYIFVTRNARLAQLSENFFLAQHIYEEDDMPAAVTDSSLAAILWLMYGSSENSILPYQRLLANCAAIPQSDQLVRDRVIKLISDDESDLSKSFMIWSRTPRGAEVMLRKSLGDPGLVTMDNIGEFIEAVKTAAGADAALEIEKVKELELERIRTEYSEASAKKDIQINSVVEELNNNKIELEAIKMRASMQSTEHEQSMGDLTSEFAKLNEKVSAAALELKKEQEDILSSIVNKFPEIQRKWDVGFAAIFGAIAIVLGVSAFLFDKFYTVSAFWDPKIMLFIIVLTGLSGLASFGAMPNILFQEYINGRKKKYAENQLSAVGKKSLLEKYELDYANHKMILKTKTAD